MADVIVDTVRSSSTHVPGRTLNSARTNHWVIDGSTGPAEEITTVESFLAGISACGVTLVQGRALQMGVPLSQLAVTIEGVRDAANTADFQAVTMRFDFTGPSREQAEELVGIYKQH